MIAQQVREFIIRNFYVSAPDQLDDTDSLLDGGIIDSTGVLEVIGFIEDTFGFTVADAEMLPENLDSIAHITAFIERKTAGRGAPA